jgi:hypothetical protein
MAEHFEVGWYSRRLAKCGKQDHGPSILKSAGTADGSQNAVNETVLICVIS